MTTRTPSPNGCQHCGIDQREHMQQWKPPVGWHKWTAPTQDQIKTRMRARRANRKENRPMARTEPQTCDDEPPPPDHSECIGPHLAPDGEHVNCDGNLL